MTIGMKLGSITDEVGSFSFLHAFFSTVSGNLEPEGWGSRFPMLLQRLYAGKLEAIDAAEARAELRNIAKGLSELGPDKVIWNLDDRTLQPPWGNVISPEITSLANYFVTSTGRDLVQIMEEIFDEQVQSGGTVEVVSY